MKYIPILFSTAMVNAILSGDKSMTRRKVAKNNSCYSAQWSGFDFTDVVVDNGYLKVAFPLTETRHRVFPKYEVGDILWVRETWQHTEKLGINNQDEDSGYIFKASENGKDWEENTEEWKWKPSIFMPKDACRIFLEVISVNPERLQDITLDCAIQEGISVSYTDDNETGKTFLYCMNYHTGKMEFINPEKSFKTLWEKINGDQSWTANPWVWVIKFKQIDKPVDFK